MFSSSSCTLCSRKFREDLSNRSILVESIHKETLLALDFHNSKNQMSDGDLVIGIVTKQTLQKLFEEGDISEIQLKHFYLAIREFLVCATKYLLQWCPFKDELLSHVVWVGFESRMKTTFSSLSTLFIGTALYSLLVAWIWRSSVSSF